MAKNVDSDNLAYYHKKISQVIADGDAISSTVTVELGENGTLGGYKTGDTIVAKTPIETVIKKMLAKQVPPVYTAPIVAISNNGGNSFGNYEIGSIITPRIKIVYNKNDGGNLEQLKIFKNNQIVTTKTETPMTYEEQAQTLSFTITFKANAKYLEGIIKNDNLGDPYPSGHILAGAKDSGAVSFVPYRQGYFWGILDTSSTETPLTSTIIRNGIKKNGAYGSGNITGIKASSVSNRKRIFVACPADKKGVTKVIMPSAMNADCTADFIKQTDTILVEGANGYEGIAYNVWVYEPAAISDDQTFTVTLG